MGKAALSSRRFGQARRTSFAPPPAPELAPQIAAYEGHELYLFDGPHYVSDDLVAGLKKPD
jgi:hypothetical protein